MSSSCPPESPIADSGPPPDPSADGGVALVMTHDNDGGARVVYDVLGDGLRRRGVKTDRVFLYGTGDPGQGRRLVDGRLGRFARLSPIAFVRLWRHFRRTRPRAVIAHLPIGNVFGLTAAWLAGVPRRVAVHHVDVGSYRPWSARLDRLAGRLGAYTRVVAVSVPVLDSMAHYPADYRRRIRPIDNGMPRRAPAAGRAALRRRFGIPEGEAVAVNVGRLSPQKNQAILIRALAGLEGVRLVLVGDGELRADLECQAAALGVADRVVFTGRVDAATVADWLGAADLFVLPSFYEGLSLALIEALHAGLPVIVSDVPSNTAPFAAHGEARGCLTVRPDDVEGWRDAIAGAAADPTLRRACAEASARLSRHYDAERMIDDYLVEAGLPPASPGGCARAAA